MTSSQPIITQNAINFTPDNKRCYAYSGDIPATGALVEFLNFNTNSEYLIGTLQFNGCANDAAPAEGQISVCVAKINGVVVCTLKVDTEDSYNGLTSVAQELVIPPFSLFQCSVISGGVSSDRLGSLTFTGEAFGLTDVGYQ